MRDTYPALLSLLLDQKHSITCALVLDHVCCMQFRIRALESHCQVQLKAMGLVTLCFPSDHSRKAKLFVPEGIEDDVKVTV